MNGTKWVAAFAVGDTREECEKALDAAFANGPINKHAVVIDQFFVGPVLNANEHCTVVRTGAVMRAIIAAVEAK